MASPVIDNKEKIIVRAKNNLVEFLYIILLVPPFPGCFGARIKPRQVAETLNNFRKLR
jgi:hypothetical protein